MSRWKKNRDYFLPAASGDSKGFSQVPPPVSFFTKTHCVSFRYIQIRIENTSPS